MTDTSTGHSSSYILNRKYFSECFDETANTATHFNTFRKAMLFITLAAVFFLMDIGAYAAWFFLCLGGIELLSIRYKRSWWIARHMLSRASGSTVNLRIDEQGIFTDSDYHQQSILWNDITDIKSTEKGFVIIHNSGTHYLSQSGLDENAVALLGRAIYPSRKRKS